MFRILVSDPLEKTGLAMLRESGHQVDELPEDERARLPEILGEYDALVVRSGTKVTAELLESADRLKVIGRAGIGVDNIDLDAATARGILVVNAPTANLIAATEHTFALMLSLARNVTVANESLRDERWDRKKYVGVELQGKILGVIGFGRIGQKVAYRAQAFDMEVLAFDPFLDAEVVKRHGAEPVDLDDLLERSDVVTLHTPLTPDTRGLLNVERIAKMKPSALLVNCGRGGVVDEGALIEALDEGRLAGAGIDVFAKEPLEDFQLANHPKVVSTPHLGAQTREAQVRISTDTARMVVAALEGSLTVTAVNLPFRPAGQAAAPYLHLAERLGRLASGLTDGALKQVRIDLWGVDEQLAVPITVAVLRGAQHRVSGETVNYVNAERLAASRGIKVVRTVHNEPPTYPFLVGVTVVAEGEESEVAGTLFHESDPRVVRFGEHQLEFQPKGYLLVVRNHDVPGVVGHIGTALGAAGVNIAGIHLSRLPGGDEAISVVRVDQAPSGGVLEGLRSFQEVKSARLIHLGGT